MEIVPHLLSRCAVLPPTGRWTSVRQILSNELQQLTVFVQFKTQISQKHNSTTQLQQARFYSYQIYFLNKPTALHTKVTFLEFIDVHQKNKGPIKVVCCTAFFCCQVSRHYADIVCSLVVLQCFSPNHLPAFALLLILFRRSNAYCSRHTSSK